ncbi:hypothetical protein X797_002746 [Metarhizium robertsii]|uniref:Uncharacterized protein n=2 Tax=Metarhizium robertsii TaxID=568076 RepID=E9F3P0_METRA|nr:uncharacterized protein MAA_06801 [Metarhizium robertsii ARSEF 23]EFY97576.2 hypothetical protein MAA_06801 [Metarhizium robertsii ARSEF 23]EXV05059.1 hypothetical protein X797_002746 [Metarhizium robertsii]
MKFPTVLLAVSGALAIPQAQQSDDIARRAQVLCGRAENINMSQCKTDTEKCITDSLAEKKLDRVPSPADFIFWGNVRTCGLGKQIGSKNSTPQNFVALNNGVFTLISGCEVQNGNTFYCNEWIKGNPGSCNSEDKDCYPMSMLPELCAEAGVCKKCEYGLSNRSGFGKRAGFSPNTIYCEMEK